MSSIGALPNPVTSDDARVRTSRAHWLNHAPFYRAASAVATVLPRRARLTAACALGGLMARACPREAAVVRANLARVVPGLAAGARARQVRELFGHFAMCVADLLTTNRAAASARLVDAGDGEEHVQAALAGGGTGIVLTAHVGNWELAGRTLVGRGGGRPVHIVMAPEADPRVERLLRDDGARVRFVTLRRPADAVPLVAALRRGEIVGMQGDRALGHRGDVAVEFFGAPVLFPLGPFVLARAAGVPVLPAFCVLGADRRYAVHVQSPLRVERGEEEVALHRWVGGLASVIARYPTQWFTFFDPWSLARAR
jgi:lauroyl/myristoyl acyltransferase